MSLRSDFLRGSRILIADFLSLPFFSSNPVRKAVLGMMAMRRMTMLSQNMASKLSPQAQELASNIDQYKKDAERVRIFTFSYLLFE